MLRLKHKAAAELVGTFAIVFAGCGSIIAAERLQVAAPSAAAVFGLVVAAMIYAAGHISGAHFNPAVTLAFAIARHFQRREVLAYWAAQTAGAFLAIAALYVLLPSGTSYGATRPAPGITVAQALGWEFVLSFFLMFVIIAVATDTRAVGTMAGAAIGATVALDALVGGAVTGASMNPARSMAPAFFEGRFDQLWIYLAGPASGTTAAALLYEWIRCDRVQAGIKG